MNNIQCDPATIEAMREWIADCQWADSVENLTDAQVISGVNRHYDGGIRQFIIDGQ